MWKQGQGTGRPALRASHARGHRQASGGVFDGYVHTPTAGAAWDEMIEPGGGVRAAAGAVHRAMAAMSSDDLRARSDSLAATFLDRG